MVNFFIDRPIFAWVLAIVVMLAGALAIRTLPISQYPAIAPPAIAIAAVFPGASADDVQSTVTQVIEQNLSGIDHLLYFGSESDADGSMTITLYFEQGTNPDIAQVQVQNKLQLATPLLPLGAAGGSARHQSHPQFPAGDRLLLNRRLVEQRGRERLHRLVRAGSDQSHTWSG